MAVATVIRFYYVHILCEKQFWIELLHVLHSCVMITDGHPSSDTCPLKKRESCSFVLKDYHENKCISSNNLLSSISLHKVDRIQCKSIEHIFLCHSY